MDYTTYMMILSTAFGVLGIVIFGFLYHEIFGKRDNWFRKLPWFDNLIMSVTLFVLGVMTLTACGLGWYKILTGMIG